MCKSIIVNGINFYGENFRLNKVGYNLQLWWSLNGNSCHVYINCATAKARQDKTDKLVKTYPFIVIDTAGSK